MLCYVMLLWKSSAFSVTFWPFCFKRRCTCGKCERDLLTNISECYCCKELEGCVEFLKSEIVLEDLEKGQELCCVTEHPGFRPVCLEKWSLRLAGGKYRTKAREYYKKTGSEERWNWFLKNNFNLIVYLWSIFQFVQYQ